MVIHALESRRLLAASFESGLLTVTGSAAADTIQIALVPFGGVTVKESGQQIYSSSTNQDEIDRIMVLGGGLGDTITVINNEADIRVTVHGDAGNDTIRANTFRGPGAQVLGDIGDDWISVTNSLGGGASVIDGGDGADTIRSVNSLSSRGSKITGGSGNDTILLTSLDTAGSGHAVRAGAGNDYIRGGGLRDVLMGDEGNDRITGGDGDDIIYGSSGSDRLDGGGGDDFIDGGFSRDTITGGDGDDTAMEDPLDVVTQVDLLM